MNGALEDLAQTFIKNQSLNLKKMMINLKERTMEKIR
jgi:hypothetical protein